MQNFIKKITIGTSSGEEDVVLDILSPVENSNSLTVLIGRNYSGKTKIINDIAENIKSKNIKLTGKRSKYSSNIKVELLDDNLESAKLLVVRDDLYHTIKLLDTIGVSIEPNKGNTSVDNYKNINRITLHKFLLEHIQDEFPITEDEWFESIENRKQLLNKLDRDMIYKFRDTFLYEMFEKATGGKLFFGLNNNGESIDVFLVLSNNHIFPYSKWSYGQKVLLNLLIKLHYNDIGILLIDEIENHLHPEYISILMNYIKIEIPQSIITSHHPHLIFSNVPTQVFYIENEHAEDDIPAIIKYNRDIDYNKPFKRKVFDLNKDYEKIANVYKLFDNYDNELLKLSASTISQINSKIYDTFKKVFHYPAINANKSSNPDLQSDELSKLIKKKFDENKKLKILDYGAGLGRTYNEIQKVDFFKDQSDKITWTLWEPFGENRDKLKLNFSALANVEIPNKEDEIKRDSYDIVILANIIHECNPRDFSKIICHANDVLDPDGTLIVVELYPLLHPEKFAVSYSKEDLYSIFYNNGWYPESYDISLNRTTSINAYWLELRKKSTEVKYKKLKKSIESLFKTISKKHTIKYNSKEKIETVIDFTNVLENLTTITSIKSYENDDWEDYLITEFYNKFIK